MPALDPKALEQAAAYIRRADALLLTSGAGMGVDSGMPDFRGDKGFWKAYPPYQHLGVSFSEMADPRWFREDPSFAWGFYGHRRNLYRRLPPHAGFDILKRWAASKPGGAFVYTSNVDGHYQKAGFEEACIVECHGAINWEQCMAKCGIGVYAAPPGEIEVDETSMRAQELPRCPNCGALSRPNVLMFGDWDWIGDREAAQSQRYDAWRKQQDGLVAVIECGAGTGLPTIRLFSQRMARLHGALIRINLREAQVHEHAQMNADAEDEIGLAGGALEVLQALDERV